MRMLLFFLLIFTSQISLADCTLLFNQIPTISLPEPIKFGSINALEKVTERIVREIKSKVELETGETITSESFDFETQGNIGHREVWKLVQSDREIAELFFIFKNGEIYLMKTHLPKQNLGTMMLASILGRSNQLRVNATLRGDNFNILKSALDRGLEFKEAVDSTPFGKSMRAIGYVFRNGASGSDPKSGAIQVEYYWPLKQ